MGALTPLRGLHADPQRARIDARATRLEDPIESQDLAMAALKVALDKKATDPAILGVAEVVGYADWFVIVSARNPRQVGAIADGIRQTIKKDHDLLPLGVEGMEACRWVLVDYGDVVIHIFQEGTRGFYDLEGLWSEATRLEVPDVPVHPADEPLFSLP